MLRQECGGDNVVDSSKDVLHFQVAKSTPTIKEPFLTTKV